MASRTEADPRKFTNFWSCITKDGTRYRHQVKQDRRSLKWVVRTEVWEVGDNWPYHTVSTEVPERHGLVFFQMRQTWSNVDEEGRPNMPPGYENGFTKLEE